MKALTAILSLLLVLLLTSEVKAQTDPIPNYFPLEVGNSWTYFDILFPPPNFEPDTTFFDDRGVFGAAIFEDSLYFDTVILPGRWIVTDKDGRMWTHIDGVGRVLLLDFTLDDGSVVDYGPDHPIYPDYIMTASRSNYIETHLGRFEDVITFSFEHKYAMDANFAYTFARGVGVVQYSTGDGQGYSIYSAYVDGSFILDSTMPESVPESFTLHGNYPNPFNPSTTITYSLTRPGDVRLEVFDLLGKWVRVLEQGFKPTGHHEVSFDATGLPSGIYFYTLTAGYLNETKKMVLLR